METPATGFSRRIPFLSSSYHVCDRWMGGGCRGRAVEGGEQLSPDHRGYRCGREEDVIDRIEESCSLYFPYLSSR